MITQEWNPAVRARGWIQPMRPKKPKLAMIKLLSLTYYRLDIISGVFQNLPMTLMFGIFETFYTENTSGIMPTIPTAVSWFSSFEHFSAHRGRVIFFCQTFENRFWRGIIALGIGFCVLNFSLNSLRFSLMRETNSKMSRAKS